MRLWERVIFMTTDSRGNTEDTVNVGRWSGTLYIWRPRQDRDKNRIWQRLQIPSQDHRIAI